MFKVSRDKKDWMAWLAGKKTSKKVSLLSNAYISQFTEDDRRKTEPGFKNTANIKK